MRRRHATALLIVGLSSPAAGQVDVRAELSRDTVALNESVEYRVTVSGGGVREVEEPRIALPIGLTLFGRSRSSEVSVVNGSAERRTTFTFTYRPFQTGATTIGPAAVRVGGDLLRIPPMPLVVVAERVAAGTGGPVGGGATPPVDPGGAGLPQADAGDGPELTGAAGLPPVFVTNRLDKDAAYVGEQVLLTFSFYQSARAMVLDQPNYASAKTPGFWSQDLNREPEISRELVGGEPYTIQRFHYALFPLTPGEKTIAPASLTLTLRDPVSFLDRGRTRTLSGDTLRLRVLPLPEEGRPAAFRGAVGRFQLDAAVEPRNPERDGPATLTLTVSGEGNLATLAPPRVAGTPGLTVFDPEVRTRTVARGTRLRGEKEFRYLLVPSAVGRVDLGRAALPYFDPEAREYRTATAELGRLAVREPAREDGRPLVAPGRELAGIRPGPVSTRSLPASASPLFLALAALAPIGVVAAALRARRGRRGRGANVPGFPDPARLREADAAASAPDVERDLVRWLEARHRARLGGLSLEERERALRVAGAPEEAVARAGEALRALEDVASIRPEARPAALARARAALEALRAAEGASRRRRVALPRT